MRILRIELPYATFGLDLNDENRVATAAPIARWTIGKSLSYVSRYYRSRGAKLILLYLDEDPPVLSGNN